MAKKRAKVEEEAQRQSRKDFLIAQKEARQRRQVYLAMAGVGALLLIVLIFGLVNELLIAPNRAVATISGEEIPLHEWEDRVRYERAQRIIVLENQYEAFEGNVGLIQQFAAQPINELFDVEGMGQIAVDAMANEIVIRQAAEARGLTVTEEEVDTFIEENFNYFGGDSPTPFPTPTETVMPTPSLTPIPTAVITEVLPTSTPLPVPTVGPTTTPLPTPTAVSLAAFEEELNTLISDFEELGVSEETYRSVVRAQLYEQKLMDALAEEQNLNTEAEHASLFILSFQTEEEANEALAVIESGDFLTTWNTIRSVPFDPESAVTARAFEILWRPYEELEASFGTELANAAFNLPLNTTSDLVVNEDETNDLTTYYVVQVSGREVRELSENALEANKRQALSSFLDTQIAGNLQVFEFWRNRVPSQPVLDPKFLAQPTPEPAQELPTPDLGIESEPPTGDEPGADAGEGSE